MPDPAGEAETGLSSVVDATEVQLPQDLPAFDHTESLFQMENHNASMAPPQRQNLPDSNDESEDENIQSLFRNIQAQASKCDKVNNPIKKEKITALLLQTLRKLKTYTQP